MKCAKIWTCLLHTCLGCGGVWYVLVGSCCHYSCSLLRRCSEDWGISWSALSSLSQVNYVVPYLKWLMECCLGNTPLLFGWVLEFSHILPRKEHSGVGGLWFWVYSAEPVKLVFAFGMDGCGILEWCMGYPVLSSCHSPHGHVGSYLSFKIRKYKREQIGIKKMFHLY